MQLNKQIVRTIFLLILVAAALFALAQNLDVAFNFIKTLFDAFAVVIAGLGAAFVLNVPLRWIEGRALYGLRESPRAAVRKLSRPVSLALTVLMALGIVALALGVVIPQLTRTISEIAAKLPGYATIALDWAVSTLDSLGIQTSALQELEIDWPATLGKIADFLRDGAGGIIGTATNVGGSVISVLVDVVFALVIALYILAQKERIGRFMKRLMAAFLPKRAAGTITRLAALSSEVFSSFISGQFLDSCILGVMCFVGMTIFRFPYPGVIGVVIGVSSLVPIVGSFVGQLIGAFLILFVSPLQALLFIVFILCLQQVEGTFIYPRIVGKSVGLPGLIVLCAVVVGGNLGGVLGALVGVPVCAVLYTLLLEAMREH